MPAGGGIHYPLGSLELVTSGRMRGAGTSKESLDPSRLERPVSTVRGIGRTTERRLRGLGIETVGDLLLHLPFRHEPPSRIANIGELQAGEEVTLRVRVVSCALRQTARRRVTVLEALVCDDTGSLIATWYNQGYLEAAFQQKPEVLLKGTLVWRRGVSSFVVKRHEILGEGEESRHILGLVPVYPSTADLSVRTIRTILHEAAPEARNLIDPLPSELRARRRYQSRSEAVLSSHFPGNMSEAERARQRLAFEELLLLQVAVLGRRAEHDLQRRAEPLGPPAGLADRYLETLPYEPTGAQRRVIGEIERDLRGAVPMRRLLHGDVGSGKTMVAAYCLLRAVEQGGQAALMAPTEVLADQHYIGLAAGLRRLGVEVALLKGSQSAGERRAVRRSLEAGEVGVVVGTHALIQEGMRYRDLRVAVVDEQHRFGVRQRDALVGADDCRETWPHMLHMSATPIPRTLSLTLYGDLDISVLDEMPAGRRPVRSRVVSEDQVARMWGFVRSQLDQGRQAYVVCPLIEESSSLEVASARGTFDELVAGELAGYRLKLLHGQLPAAEKAETMAAYVAREVDVLVSTSVIEVGVDVANATVMVIMGARRFGLSQLHQLRGRVGRGDAESYCFLLSEGDDEPARERLALFARTPDGFELAEADLLARGEGQLFGERQSGLSDLQVASLLRDRRLLEDARREAERLMDRAAGAEAPVPARFVVEAARERFARKIDWMDRA